jgi:hypothetical protein
MRWRTSIAAAVISSLTVLVGVSCNDSVEVQRSWPCPIADSPGELISKLASAYQTRNYDRFRSFFSTAGDGAPYLYSVDDSAGTTWDVGEELRLHRRMFWPEDPLPGETPVRQDLWFVCIDIYLEPQTDWSLAPQYYRSAGNPGGLDPARWRAFAARYRTYVLFDLQGPTDYQVNGGATFVVIEDLTMEVCTDGKFLLYRWEDLGSIQIAAASPAPVLVSWSQAKVLYR